MSNASRDPGRAPDPFHDAAERAALGLDDADSTPQGPSIDALRELAAEFYLAGDEWAAVRLETIAGLVSPPVEPMGAPHGPDAEVLGPLRSAVVLLETVVDRASAPKEPSLALRQALVNTFALGYQRAENDGVSPHADAVLARAYERAEKRAIDEALLSLNVANVLAEHESLKVRIATTPQDGQPACKGCGHAGHRCTVPADATAGPKEGDPAVVVTDAPNDGEPRCESCAKSGHRG